MGAERHKVERLAVAGTLRGTAESPAETEGDPVGEIVDVPAGDHVGNKPIKVHSLIERILSTDSDIQIVGAADLTVVIVKRV